MYAEENYRSYLDLAIRSHMEELKVVSEENADSLCLTATILRMCVFFMLSEQSPGPYTPLMQWLHISHNAGRVFHATWKGTKDKESSVAWKVVNRPPLSTPSNESLWAHGNRKGFEDRLQRN